MKFKKSLLALTVMLSLTACSDDDDKDKDVTPIPSPDLALVAPQQDAEMVEDFPLAMYVTYPDGEQVVSSITSIDVNWPMVDIHQSGLEYGFIDGDSDELFYHSVANHDLAASNASDLERQGDLLWYVDEDSKLYQYDRENEAAVAFDVLEGAEFSELAIDEQGQDNIWLYDQKGHQLVHFNADDSALQVITLSDNLEITGLSISEDNILMLAQENERAAVLHYQVAGSELTHQGSWYLAGFGESEFNDIGLMPDGRVAVSTTDTEHNLFLVMDKSQLIGQGPIEDSGELALVAQTPLAESIKQPSGLWSLQDQSWMMITDQAEMFALDANFNITEKVDVVFDSINCNQGCTEAIVGGVDEFFALTDSGLVGQFNKVDGHYRLTQEHQISVKNEEGDSYRYSGLGMDEATGEYYLVPDQSGEDQTDVLIVLNPDFSLKEKHNITFSGKAEGSIFEYDAQGVQYADGHVYVLSEKYTKLIQLNLSGEIVAVYDLSEEDVSDPSDFAIRDGEVYILGDHENDEPVPPVSRFVIELHD